MRFKTFINESLDSPPAHFDEKIEIHPELKIANVVRYRFHIGTHSLICVTFRNMGGEWEMALSRNGAHGIDRDLEGREASTTALRMYSTVIKIVEAFTGKYMVKNDVLTIGSWEGPKSSQASLYYKLIKRLESRFPKLRVRSVPNDQHYVTKIDESWDSPVPFDTVTTIKWGLEVQIQGG